MGKGRFVNVSFERHINIFIFRYSRICYTRNFNSLEYLQLFFCQTKKGKAYLNRNRSGWRPVISDAVCETYDTAGEWYEQINTMQFHYVISSGYWGISWVALLGFAAYFVLLYINADRLPPLVSAAAISFIILLNILQITFAVQLSKNINNPLELSFYVYHFNILLLSARAIQRHMLQQVEIFKNRAAAQDNNIRFKKFYDIINSLSRYTFVIFVALFLVVAIIEIIFVLIGQGLDAPIKAFTDTADWTFSKQTPPPPSDYEGHYLCTVAAGGHKKVVKPLRFGSRRGATIIVNRQLCIANAFEEVIQIKFPSFHRMVRHIYDTYGYPLSKLITNPLRADVVYIIMKPLEWIFLLFLYLVDVRPEQRIRNQYVLQFKR